MTQRLAYAGIFASGALIGLAAGKETSPLLLLCFAANTGLWMLRRGPRCEELEIEGKAFTVPHSRWSAVSIATMLAYSISQARWMLGGDTTALESFRPFYRVLGSTFVVLAVVFTALAVLEVWRPSAIRVMPDGVGNNMYKRRLVRWENMRGPITVSGEWRAMRTLTLAPGKGISGMWLTTELDYLARVIEYYRVHPEHRAAIGTKEELAWLKTALPEWFEAYQRS